MALFIEFLLHQWLWVAALLTCVMLLIFHESRRAGKTLTPQQLSALVNREEALVVDLRDPKEYQAGHIVDAINIPYNKVPERIGELESHKDRPIVLVCKLGQNSSAVGKQLAAKGFDKVHRLQGGISEWRANQMPLVKQ